LPADVWHAASVPVGVRLQLVGDAQAVDIAYRTTTGNLGYRGDGAGVTFSVWRAGRQVGEADAELGDGLIRLRLGATAAERPATIYLPEGMLPVVRSLTAVHGEIAPAPPEPRWLAYGDSTTQGWIASGPAQAWAAIAARKAGLDLVNMGYAQSGRGEIASAEQMAALDADVITVSYGASCWSRVPHSLAMVESGLDGFLDVLRQGHPKTPIIVISPVIRPDGDEEPNRLGATLDDIRHAIESVTRLRIREGDVNLALLPGAGVVDERHLVDGIYPGDEGHKRIAAAVGKYLFAAMRGSLYDLAMAALEEDEDEEDDTGSAATDDEIELEEADASPTALDDAAAEDEELEELEAASSKRIRRLPRKRAVAVEVVEDDDEEEEPDEDGPDDVEAVEEVEEPAPRRRRTARGGTDRPLYRRSARAPAV
jgi:lysophospholipase L1-like esterase